MRPEITKTEDETQKTGGRFIWIFFGLLTVFVYFFGLTIPFVGPDEPRYAEVAREMLERGDWITPTLGGVPWFEKPVLLYWLEIVSYKLFGVNEFAARLGPALCGIGTIASLYVLGRFQRSTIEDSRSSNDLAKWLAFIAASTLGIIVFSRGASFDIIVTFPITAALVSFYLYDSQLQPPATARGSDTASSGRNVSASLIVFYVFIGIALLAKGLIGIILPLGIVGCYFLLSRRLPSRAFVTSLLWGTLVAAAIASVWYVPMYLRHGDRFIDEFFIQQHFQRFTSNKYEHPQPFYFFFCVLPLMTLPWLPFFLSSVWDFARERFHHMKEAKALPNEARRLLFSSPLLGHSSSPLLLFSAAWLIVPLVFFSFSGSKLPGYILPAAPAAIILSSMHIFDLARKSDEWRSLIFLIAALTFGAVVLLLIFAVPRYAEPNSVKSLIETAKQKGHLSDPVLTFQTISHSAEFYAAGRLLRDADGKQRQIETVAELIEQINAQGGQPVLVLAPLDSTSKLTGSEKITTALIADNGKLAIAAVSLK
jgi:4-amino-4-deoxy-L-arabinose transferase-like glycosyltransferase